MSQRAVAPDGFVPFDPLPSAGAKAPATPGTLKVVPKSEAAPAFSPLSANVPSHAQHGSNASGKPVVTLQREGERITGIRIECGCGQVIELACSY